MIVRRTISSTLAAGLVWSAAIAHAGIVEDFQFNDTNGTVITNAANSINASNKWLSQNTAINAGVQGGSFRIQKGGESTPVPGQVGNTLNIADVTSGKIWLVTDIAGWVYTATPSGTSERLRFAFLDNSTPAANSSTITAEANIDRGGGALQLNGTATGFGSTNTPNVLNLSLVRTTPLSIAIELNKTANTYTVSYKDDTAPWVSLGSANVGDINASMSTGVFRIGGSLRFAFTGSFNDVGEFVDVDRIYVTDVDPTAAVPEPTAFAFMGIAAAAAWWARRRLGA